MISTLSSEDTIVALATPQGVGAIAIIRLSGKHAIAIANKVFAGKNLEKQSTHTIHFGNIVDGDEVIDEVLISIFIAPHSFTKEDAVEISTHGSPYVVKRVLEVLLKNGARLATAGEFTKRAFVHGRFDLAQAEAVADLIASDTDAAHKVALNQMRGGFSSEIKALRERLIHFASLIELELDFSEEDVEFADRKDVRSLIEELRKVIAGLMKSFQLGNVIKNGVPTVIAGKPNAGKSTLLNALLNEEKAIVSDLPGTTRDFIEDHLVIEGINFRFIDTAGLREALDKIEAMGVERTYTKMKEASLIIFLFDLAEETPESIIKEIEVLKERGVPFIAVGNKSDKASEKQIAPLSDLILPISASKGENLDPLKKKILEAVHLDKIKTDQTIVTNLRHYQGLKETYEALDDVISGLDEELTNDFLALDIRNALHHLGELTGEITTDDLLENIFSKFCIGK
ncbi:MAG: tRNA uridine-5-carboxymethylaminomethyl(34) synthesis GTPase MnmE [Bacteroidetes bacterium]|nr:tRNA uridine-5-carboxymethylaminomethyl(34) synthesis GTPase MnmE [Bacteroidota bacterium]MDA1122498.1 tRNA uridine-5-carboxymethylaminomethyl(34) synthesis GTPase MnmE [Bacteroidota bacterium]